MNIAIDARWIFGEITGIGAYTRELIRHLARLDRASQYTLYFDDAALRDRTLADAGLVGAPNFTAEILPYGVFSPWNQVLLPLRLRSRGIAVFHSTNYMIPLPAFPRGGTGRVRCVVTIHDVIPLLFPNAAPRSRKSRVFPLYRRLMLAIGRRASRIIVDSATSRADVIRLLNIRPERQRDVRAIHCGIAEHFTPAGRAAEAPAASRPRTVLYVGRSDPYKNLVTLVEAFAAARSRCPFPLRLTIAGPRDPRYPQAAERAAQLGITEAVTWTGYLDDRRLVAAYREAAVLVLPSRYEGFGLPVLEAMACGTPVVCSDIPTLREIAGAAALFVNTAHPADLAGALARVLTDGAFARDLVNKGLGHATLFTWARTAEQTLGVYRELQPATREA